MKLNKKEIEVLIAPLNLGKPTSIKQIREITKEIEYLEKMQKSAKDKEVDVLVTDFVKKEFRGFEGWNRQARKLLLDLDKKLG